MLAELASEEFAKMHGRIEGGEPTDLYLIIVDDRPAGFIQTYLVSDYSEYQALVDVGEGVAGGIESDRAVRA